MPVTSSVRRGATTSATTDVTFLNDRLLRLAAVLLAAQAQKTHDAQAEATHDTAGTDDDQDDDSSNHANNDTGDLSGSKTAAASTALLSILVVRSASSTWDSRSSRTPRSRHAIGRTELCRLDLAVGCVG